MGDLQRLPESLEQQIARLTPIEKGVCKSLNVFNQLRSFKLDVFEILDWKDTIVRLFPDIEPERLQFAIDKMITGELEYNVNLGIQNIVRALNEIEPRNDGNGYKLKSKMRW